MTNDERSPNSETRNGQFAYSGFVIRISFVIRHSSFVILLGCTYLLVNGTLLFSQSAMAANRCLLLLGGVLLTLGSGCRSSRTCVETPFSGLKAELIQANTNGGRLRLLIVHGMSDHTQGYSSNFVDTIGRKLNLGNPART